MGALLFYDRMFIPDRYGKASIIILNNPAFYPFYIESEVCKV